MQRCSRQSRLPGTATPLPRSPLWTRAHLLRLPAAPHHPPPRPAVPLTRAISHRPPLRERAPLAGQRGDGACSGAEPTQGPGPARRPSRSAPRPQRTPHCPRRAPRLQRGGRGTDGGGWAAAPQPHSPSPWPAPTLREKPQRRRRSMSRRGRKWGSKATESGEDGTRSGSVCTVVVRSSMVALYSLYIYPMTIGLPKPHKPQRSCSVMLEDASLRKHRVSVWNPSGTSAPAAPDGRCSARAQVPGFPPKEVTPGKEVEQLHSLTSFIKRISSR